MRTLAGRLFPDQKLEKVAPESPLYRAFPALAVKEARDRQTNAARPVELEGIVVKDRLVLVYSKNDMVGQLKQVSDPFGNGYDAETCRKLVVNMVAYAMQS